MKFLVDNSVFHHAVENRGFWKDNGRVMWGGPAGIPVNTGRIESFRKRIEIKKERGGPQGDYIAALALSYIRGEWQAHTTDALKLERLRHPLGRFQGGNYGDLSWFDQLRPENHTTLHGFELVFRSNKEPIEALRSFLTQVDDIEYQKLCASLEECGVKNSTQDAWHILCVEKLNLDKFLTCDAKLVGQLKSISNVDLRRRLTDIVCLPSDACDILNLPKISDRDLEELTRLLQKS